MIYPTTKTLPDGNSSKSVTNCTAHIFRFKYSEQNPKLRVLCVSDNPSDIIDDPFSVVPPEPLWKTLPIFIIFSTDNDCFSCSRFVNWLNFYSYFPLYFFGIKRLVASFCNKCLLISIRMKVTKIIDEPTALDAKLFVSTHTCLFESLVLLANLGHFRPMAANSPKESPFSINSHSLDPLYVSRGKGAKNGGLVEQLKQSLDENVYRHVIFPEGTYSNGKHVLQFKSGAFVPGHPVTPIAFTFPEYTPFWNREESSFGVQIYRILGRLYTPVTIHFLPLYTIRRSQTPNFCRNVRVLLGNATGRSLSKYEVKDSPITV